jgi:hypothetical protein
MARSILGRHRSGRSGRAALAFVLARDRASLLVDLAEAVTLDLGLLRVTSHRSTSFDSEAFYPT